MSKEKKNKLLKASELVKGQDDKQTEISNLVALSMQTGYELGKQNIPADYLFATYGQA